MKAASRYRQILWEHGVRQCRWCKTALTKRTATLEHIVPLSIGGENSIDNLTLACKHCNNSRGSNINWKPPVASIGYRCFICQVTEIFSSESRSGAKSLAKQAGWKTAFRKHYCKDHAGHVNPTI